MNILINLPDSYNVACIKNGSIFGQMVLNAVKNGKVISNTATKGDVIRALFPNEEIEEQGDTFGIVFERTGRVTTFDATFSEIWWNALYMEDDK